MSKFSQLLDKIISKESKEKIKSNIIDPIVNELSIQSKYYIIILIVLYLSLLIPIILVILILLRNNLTIC